MITNKAIILCVLKVLEEYSDENHILGMNDIQDRLEKDYDIRPDRRTVYTAIETLWDFGYDISNYEENGKGYYLKVRDFDSADIRLLIDAINSFEYISPSQTAELTDKLRAKLSIHDRKRFGPSNLLRNDKKSQNQEVFLNIELLDQAINERKKVSFTYMNYDYNKKLVPRRKEPYIANPYSMIMDSEHYYLVMILEGKDQPSFYRIDLMRNVEILDEKISISKADAKLDSVKKVVYAHTGEPRQIKLRCDKSALRLCLERFGLDIMIIPLDNGEKFEAVFSAPPEGLVYWCLQQLQTVEVVEPADLREQITEIIKNNKYQIT